MKRSLSVNDTNVLKGVALLLLLAHHLFYVQDGYYDDILIARGHYLVQEIGIACKVCVAVFVFLSGYGLAAKTDRTGGIRSLKEFYLQRYTKLLMNYWFVWLVFVPIGVFVFGRDFNDAYGNHAAVKFILDFLGVSACLGMHGYNPTWWFYSCIILLYAIFPFVYRMRRNVLFVILCGIIVSFLPVNLIIAPIKFYILSFILGIYMCNILIINDILPPPKRECIVRLWFFLMLLLAMERSFNNYPLFMDVAIVCTLFSIYLFLKIPIWLENVLSFIGRHSMNIFLFHTFIYFYWFKDFIYLSRNPIIIFLTLLFVCIPISMFLEWLKKIIGFNRLIQKIQVLNVGYYARHT